MQKCIGNVSIMLTGLDIVFGIECMSKPISKLHFVVYR